MPQQLDFFWNTFLFLTTFKSRKEEEICCFGANHASSLDLVLLLFFFLRLMHLDLTHENTCSAKELETLQMC